MKSLDILRNSHEKILDYSKSLRFDNTHIFHQSLISLHGSIIEFCGAIIVLLENDGKIGVPSIFRSLTETFVEFKNLANDKKYGYYMDASDVEQWLKLLKNAKGGDNPFLIKMSEMPDLEQQIDNLYKKQNDLQSKGYKPLSIFDKFRMAEMENVYRSVYNELSADSHSNIRALFDRHISLVHEKKEVEVVFYKDEPIENFEIYITPSTEYLVNSGYTIHKELNSTKVMDIENIVKSFK